jgi:hypothetical protein
MELGPVFPIPPFQAGPAQSLYSLTPQAQQSEDAATVYINIEAYVTEEYPVLYIDIQPSGVEAAQYVDAATIYIDISNTGGECFSSFSGLFFDADAQPRWATTSYRERWFCDEDATNARWAMTKNQERWFCDEDAVDARWAVVGLSSDTTGC